MNASFTKRLISYIIDFIFISAILMIVTYFIPKNTNVKVLNNDINELTEQVLNNEITLESYINEYADYLSNIERENVIYNLASFIIIFIYYVIVPIIFKTTLGKYIMHLSIKHKNNNKLNILNTMIRSSIDVGLLYLLVAVFLVQVIDSKTYLLALIILGIIQIILVIISIIMILYRSDKRGLQDILSRSNVVLKEVRK